jgi:outer membrane protein assembly factor BamE (lipoprotein component of BamABCDE complex)
LPHGRASYAARIGADGRLISVEQRLTRENLNRLEPGVSQESDVRDLLGPPSAVETFPRLQRRVWSYQTQGIEPQLIIVQFSADGFVREAYMIDDPDFVSPGE